MRISNPPSQFSVQDAIAQIARSFPDTDHEAADKLGCSATTVANLRNKNAMPSAKLIAAIGAVYGLEYLQPFTALFGAHLVPGKLSDDDVIHLPAGVADFLAKLLTALADGKLTPQEKIVLADIIRPLLPKLTKIVHDADGLRRAA